MGLHENIIFADIVTALRFNPARGHDVYLVSGLF
jgi:hypothetical protein